MSVKPQVQPHLLTPGEVALLLRVDPKTVTRWARSGILRSVRTPGGHRRYATRDVEALAGKIADDETGLSGRDLQEILDCLDLAPGADQWNRREQISKTLASLSAGSVIRVTG